MAPKLTLESTPGSIIVVVLKWSKYNSTSTLRRDPIFKDYVILQMLQ